MRTLITLMAVAVLASCNDSGTNEEAAKADSPAATTATTPAEPAPNTLTDAEKSDGWQLLFDGTTKNGWHVYNNKSDGSAWKIEDGALHNDTTNLVNGKRGGGGDLTSDSAYENFELSLEWKISKGGNSGIIFLANEAKKYESSYFTGPEMQVLDTAHADAKIEKHHAGDLYDLISASPQTVKPSGEWNQARIVINKGALEFYLNGPKVVSTTLWDDNWKKMIAASKFKAWKDFGTFKKGKIVLQDHGDPVWYRNIKIKNL